jgi:hypothetical protein
MKLWTLATDTNFGTETHTFKTEAEFNDFMLGFLADHWHSDEEIPDDWSEAWDAMDNQLGGMDTFQTAEIELFDHPVVAETLDALHAAHQKLEKADSDAAAAVTHRLAAAIQTLTPPPPPVAPRDAV